MATPSSSQSSAQPNSVYDTPFPASNYDGTGMVDVNGVTHIRDYIIANARWGLPRRSNRARQSPSSMPVSPPSTGSTNTPTMRETRSSRKRPSASPDPQAERPAKRQRTNSGGSGSGSGSGSDSAASCVIVGARTINIGSSSSSNNNNAANPPPNPNRNATTLSPDALYILRPPRRAVAPEYGCLHCGRRPGTSVAACSPQTCYPQFRTAHFEPARAKLEIKRTAPGPHETGLGVFVRAGQTVRKGEWLGQYLGELLPPDAPEGISSAYVYSLPAHRYGGEGVREVLIDSRTHGNWTRFMNSSCRPNVAVLPEQVGKVRMIAFQAERVIRGGEQLLISYGRAYFKERNILCCCDAKAQPHLPPPSGEYVGGRIKQDWGQGFSGKYRER